MSTLVNQAELARLLEITAKTVRAWEAQGCPVEVKSGRRGEPSGYRVGAVVHWREAQIARTAARNLPDPEDPRRRKLTAEAALVEIELERLRGRVVDLDIVKEEVALSTVRTRLLAIGPTLAPQVAGARTAGEVRALIDDRVVEAMEAICSGKCFGFEE